MDTVVVSYRGDELMDTVVVSYSGNVLQVIS